MPRALAALLIGILFTSLLQCSSSDGGGNPYENSKTYFSTMTNMVVEVAYETGAEPYTGTALSNNLWNFTYTNLGNLFQGRTTVPTIVVPTDISQMKALPAQNKTSWTNDDLVALAAAQRTGNSTATTGDFFVVFLNGYLDNQGSPDMDVIGVSLTNTTVVAIFKPVVISSSSALSNGVRKYVEQSTVVHELGHALGLVNNGLPLYSQHQDTAHGAHCTNTHCAMYWENDGGTNAAAFVQQYITTGNENIYGQECLDDAHHYQP